VRLRARGVEDLRARGGEVVRLRRCGERENESRG
jgi:hypothetical protein